MDIAAYSTAMSMSETMVQASIAMAKNVMEITEQQGAALVEMAEMAVPTDTIAINMRV